MNKTLGVSLALLLIGLSAFSQSDTTKYWKKGGSFALNFSQVSLTNWAAGGQNSVAFNGLLNLYANYKKENVEWSNTIDMGYGVINQGAGGYRKSDDRIEANSIYGRKLSDKWNYAGLINFKSQFAEGYNLPNDSDLISDFLAPGWLLVSIGFEYKPSENFSLFLSPITGKVTFVNNQNLANAGAFGVEAAEFDGFGNIISEGRRIRGEFGGLVKFAYRRDLMENVTFALKGDFFSNYLNKPENIDINLDGIITMKINKWLSASLAATMIYDEDIKIFVDKNENGIVDAGEMVPRTQFRQIFGAGLSMKF